MSKRPRVTSLKQWAAHRQRLLTIAILAVFTIAGVAYLAGTRAATPFVAAEPENGTVTAPASKVADATASGGSAIRFGTASQPGACVGAPNTPGGADPWGGCWPGPQNTGVPAGTALKRVPQDITSGTGWRWSASDDAVRIESCGAVLDKLNIASGILMRVGNNTKSPESPCATIQNSIVAGVVYLDDSGTNCQYGCGPLIIKDSETYQTGSTFYSNVMIKNWWMYRVNTHGGRGPQCMGACGMYDSWSHGLYLEGSVHHNAVGTNGVGSGPFIIQHNYLNCADFSAVDSSLTDGGCSADIGLYGDFDDLQNITISRNYLAPALSGGNNISFSQPGYCLQTGMNVNKPYNKPSNLIIRQNVFAKGYSGKCGAFNISSGWEGAVRGNVWEGNTWDDGTTANPT